MTESFTGRPQSFQPPLPFELLETIVEDAWLTCTGSADRWELFDALHRVDPTWAELADVVASRIVLLECSFDIARYNALTIADGSMWEHGFASHSCLQAASRSHLRYALVPEFSIFGDCNSWSEHFQRLRVFVPHCYSAELIFKKDTSDLHKEDGKWEAMFTFLATLPELRHLHLRPEVESDAFLPRTHIPQVTHLRLSTLKACRCEGWERERCLFRNILMRMPAVRHIRLEGPTFLRRFTPCRTPLESLTLDAPPMQAIARREPYSSVMEYNITAALNRGLMRRDKKDWGKSPRCIIVNTGVQLPLGWEHAQAACVAHGVTLERRCVWMKPVKRETVVELDESQEKHRSRMKPEPHMEPGLQASVFGNQRCIT